MLKYVCSKTICPQALIRDSQFTHAFTLSPYTKPSFTIYAETYKLEMDTLINAFITTSYTLTHVSCWLLSTYKEIKGIFPKII